MRYSSLLGIALLYWTTLTAQNDLAIGQWQSHLPYRDAEFVTQSDDHIFFATEWSVLALDKTDFATEFFSKTNRLSNVGVETIKYNRAGATLIVVYEDGVVDLLTEQGTSTLNQIKNFNNVIGDKTINHIFVENDSIIYLSASYGVSKLNIKREEFVYTTSTPIPVYSFTVWENQLYFATDEGVYTTPATNNFPENFFSWELLELDGLPLDYSSRHVTVFDNKLFLEVNNTLAFIENGQLNTVFSEASRQLNYLSTEGSGLITGWSRGDFSRGKVLYFENATTFKQLPDDCVFNPLFAIEDSRQDGFIWFADQARGYKYVNTIDDNSCQEISFNSPYSHHVYDVAVTDEQVYVAAGGVNATFSPVFRVDGLFERVEGRWSEFNQFVTPELQGKPLWDFLDVAVHPTSGKVYTAAFVEGLLEKEGDVLTIYDDSNSSLNNAVGDETRTRVSGLAFDSDNNLWVSNYLAERPLSVLTNEGNWQSFALRGGCSNEAQLTQLVVDEFGYKWMVSVSTNIGLVVFDEGDPQNPSDDRCKIFTTANSALPTNKVNTLTLDLEGDIWVGTSEGVAVFQFCDVFDDNNNCDFFLPKTDQDANNLGLLLKSEDVRAIAIDGANRKWFGTTSGIFVQSPDGTTQEARFTAENSPLFDNIITAIAIVPNSGEVYIGTTRGLISYRGQATAGRSINRKRAVVFPNPVRPDYEGPIAIKGLAENANVKITDVNGQLVYETRALGGQAIWDGRDYNGRRANTGVYLVFATSNNTLNPDAIVAKFLFIR